MTGYPWSTGDELFAADLNAAIAFGLSATRTIVSDTAPAGALDNVLWWDSSGTGLYIRYNDGNSSQWVVAGNQNTLTDAPADGQIYGRHNSVWTALTSTSGSLPLTGGTMVGPLNYTATGGSVSRAAQDRAADFANVLDFGADPMGVADSASAINAALATGNVALLPKGNFHVRSQINAGPYSVLRGAGKGQTIITVSDDFSSVATGVISLTGREEQSPVIEDLCITFAQPSDQASRASFKTLAAGGTGVLGGTGVMYPPAIIVTNSNRFQLRHLRIEAAWDGIVGGMTGTNDVGGCLIDNVEMGALSRGIALGRARDFVHIDHYHFWNFGISGNLFSGVFSDGSVFSAKFGENGGVNGINAVDFNTLFGRIYITDTNTWGHLANLQLDLGATLEIPSCGFIQIGTKYFTGNAIGVNTNSAISVGGGVVQINNTYVGSSRYPPVTHTGGVLHISGSQLGSNGIGIPAVVQSGGQLFIDGSRVTVSDTLGAWTSPIVQQTGGTLHFVGNSFAPTNSGAQPGMTLTDNAANYVADNNFNGWPFTAPGPLGKYGPNSDGKISYPLTVAGLLTALGNANVVGALTASSLLINSPAGTQRSLLWETSGLLRWGLTVSNTAETGGNTGSDWQLLRYADNGTTLLDLPISINRATGVITLAHAPIYAALPASAANDAAAATAGVPVGGVYRNGNSLQVRVT